VQHPSPCIGACSRVQQCQTAWDAPHLGVDAELKERDHLRVQLDPHVCRRAALAPQLLLLLLPLLYCFHAWLQPRGLLFLLLLLGGEGWRREEHRALKHELPHAQRGDWDEALALDQALHLQAARA